MLGKGAFVFYKHLYLGIGRYEVFFMIDVHFFGLHWEMKGHWSRVNLPVSFHFPMKTKGALHSLY